MGRGLTQGDPVYPTIFNIVVNVVVWGKLREVYRPQESPHRLVWETTEKKIVLYADNGRIAGRNPILVQGTLIKIVHMFEWLGLYKNMGKTKSMTCTPDSFGSSWARMPTSVRQRAKVPPFGNGSGRG